MIEGLLHDVRHSMRKLRRDPVLAATATATLAMYIGANTTVFRLPARKARFTS